MPSVRPRLVEEGTPIAAASISNHDGLDDDSAKVADNLFVIGNNNAAPTTKRSSLSMSASGQSGPMDLSLNSSGRRGSSTRKGGTSSLARAAKGTFIQDSKKTVVQTSFVVGGSPSAFQDEKKSGDSPYMADDSRKSRPSITTTSYEIPGNSSFSAFGQQEMEVDGIPSATTRRVSKPSMQPTAYVIGSAPEMDISRDNNNDKQVTHEVEKMEGVIDLSEKPPLCVIDGANIAYAYAKAWQGGSSSLPFEQQGKLEPDVRGIVVACEYFASVGIRVLAVIPQTWTIRDPHEKILKKLEEQGILVEAPSRDDDDAYALTIARRENLKAQQRGDGPGYVMSNDMFRDAQARATTEGGGDELKEWLTEGSMLDSRNTGPGRISFAFLDTGSIDDHGDKVLDILPNPRHPLIQFVEHTRAKH